MNPQCPKSMESLQLPISIVFLYSFLGNPFKPKLKRIKKELEEAYQLISEDRMNEALLILQQLSDNYPSNGDPLLYANIHVNMGIANFKIGMKQKSEEALRRAIPSFIKVIESNNIKDHPDDYSAAQYYQGRTLLWLFVKYQEEEMIQGAVNAFKESLKYRSVEKDPEDYALSQFHLGNSLSQLASIRDMKTNLNSAIDSFNKALKIQLNLNKAINCAHTFTNLGNAYQKLSKIDQPVENLLKALRSYELGLEKITSDANPIEHGDLLNNIGIANRRFFELTGDIKYLLESMDVLNQARDHYSKNNLDFVKVLTNLGNAYADFGVKTSDIESLEKAIQYYSEVIEKRPRSHSALKYGVMMYNLGNANVHIYEINQDVNFLYSGIKYYIEGMNINEIIQSINDFKNITNNLRAAYEFLYEYDNDDETILNGISLFENIIADRKLDGPQMAFIKYNIANLNYEIFKKSNNEKYLQLAKGSFDTALKELNDPELKHYYGEVKSKRDLCFN